MPPSVATRLPFQIGERAIAIAIAVANREHFAEFVIRDAGGERLAPRRNVFDAAQADVEVASLRGLIERRELHLQELRRAAQLSRDQLGDLDVEADQLRGIARIGFNERRAAFGIAAPPQRLRCRRGRADCADHRDRDRSNVH